MRRILIALAVVVASLGLWACEADPYQQNDLELISAYRAKTMCTCMWTLGMSEEFCADYSLQNPPVATYRIDVERKVVESQAVLMWGDRARFVSERFGCVFD
ncbi:MAG: hypothetical protein ABIJ09_05505 [Pseudomonadota bacterium]